MQFNITVTSDTWCYVGKKRLEAGIAAYKAAHPSSADTFKITWLPFQLDPSAPSPGIDKKEFYHKKFGDPARVAMMHKRLAEIGAENGIGFKFGGRIGNTRNSHRVIDLAKSKSPEMADLAIQRLFEQYFENEQDITSPDVLIEAGVHAGIEESEVKRVVESDDHGPEVDRELKQARQNLVNSVPHFVFQDKYEISGGQEAEVFRNVLEKIKELDG